MQALQSDAGLRAHAQTRRRAAEVAQGADGRRRKGSRLRRLLAAAAFLIALAQQSAPCTPAAAGLFVDLLREER